MKNTLLKDTFREIRNSLGRFLAIFAIVVLGVGFFAGIKATAPDMKLTADKYFDDYRLMDIWLLSTMGFDEEDIGEIEKISGIDGIAPSYSMDVLMDDGEKVRVIKLLSIPKTWDHSSHINRINLVEGRYPEEPGECLAESGSMTTKGLEIGSKIKFYSGTDDDISDSLSRNEYTVVGLVESPLYISFERGTSSIGNGKIDSYIMVPEDDFDLPVYTDVYVTVRGAREVLTYDDEYDRVLDPIKSILEDVGEVRVEARYQDIMAEANRKLDEARQELKEGEERQQRELREAEEKLYDAKKQIDRGEEELRSRKDKFYETIKDAEKRLTEEEGKLKAGEEEYRKAFISFNELKNRTTNELEEGERKIKNAERDLEEKEVELNQLRLSLDSIDNEEEKAKTLAIIKAGEEEIAKGKEEILSSKAILEKSRKDLAYAEQELEATQRTLGEGRIRLEMGREKLENSKKRALGEFSSARRKLDSSIKEYEKGYKEYIEAKYESDRELDEARDKIIQGGSDLEAIEKPKWYVIKRNETKDFIDYELAADRIDAIAKVFPVFFFIIAVLVCLTTMTRMVDEQRIYIGSLKAMGYKNLAIASKYLIYAALASICGSIVGLFIGFKVFPTVIFNAYRIMYIMPPVVIEFNTFYALISTVVAVFATTVAAWLACYSELTETPALLLRPKAPKVGKRILLERVTFIWSRLKFTQKVTARNLFRYKKRLIMTIFGISGCTALLMAGFGLKDSIMSIAIKQFDEIYKYQMEIELNEGIIEGESTGVLEYIRDDSRFKDYISIKEQVVNIGRKDRKETVNLIVPEALDKFDSFITLNNRITGEGLKISDEGVVLTEKMAKLLKVEVGDQIYIEVDDDKSVDVPITGITENYAFHYIYISPNLYKRVFEDGSIEFRKLLVKTTETDELFEDKLSMDILDYDAIASVEFITGISKSFKDVIASLNYVILVLILSAGALAFVVLYNLTNINISERIREIATIKVLGFYDEEVSKYVYRENSILTLIGTTLGLVLGIFLHKFIILTAETDFIMFGREIRAISFLYSALLTILFSAFVNCVMYFKLKKIDMVESLKSIE